MCFNENFPWFYRFTHQDGEEFVCLNSVFDGDMEHHPLFGVHGGFPELLRVHLSETFVALDAKAGLTHLFCFLQAFLLRVRIIDALSLCEFIQGWLCNVEIAFFDEWSHVSVKECEE